MQEVAETQCKAGAPSSSALQRGPGVTQSRRFGAGGPLITPRSSPRPPRAALWASMPVTAGALLPKSRAGGGSGMRRQVGGAAGARADPSWGGGGRHRCYPSPAREAPPLNSCGGRSGARGAGLQLGAPSEPRAGRGGGALGAGLPPGSSLGPPHPPAARWGSSRGPPAPAPLAARPGMR